MEYLKIDHENLNNPIKIEYWDATIKADTFVMADSCTGNYLNGIMSWHFITPDKTRVIVPELAIHKKYKDKSNLYGVNYLYQRYYLRRLISSPEITLRYYPNFENELSRLPENTNQVWEINYADSWIIETTDDVILHVGGGGEFLEEGDFNTALKKMFPKNKVKIIRTVCKEVTEVLA